MGSQTIVDRKAEKLALAGALVVEHNLGHTRRQNTTLAFSYCSYMFPTRPYPEIQPLTLHRGGVVAVAGVLAYVEIQGTFACRSLTGQQ